MFIALRRVRGSAACFRFREANVVLFSHLKNNMAICLHHPPFFIYFVC